MPRKWNRLPYRRTICAISVVVILISLTYKAPTVATKSSETKFQIGAPYPQPTLENFDIRFDFTTQAPSAFVRAVRNNGRMKASATSAVRAAETRLRTQVSTINLDWNSALDIPEIVGTSESSRAMLTPPSIASREKIVRDFVVAYHDLFGLSSNEVAGLRTTADYTNPAGNISWIQLSQEINGNPVFQGELQAALSPRGEVGRISNSLAPGLANHVLKTTPQMDAKKAIIAGLEATGTRISESDVKIQDQQERSVTFTGQQFSRESKAELVYFPLAYGEATLAWSMVLWQPTLSYIVVVDANDGRLLFRKCITYNQTQTASYNVYDNDSPAPFSPSTAIPGTPPVVPGIQRSTLNVISELPAFDNLGWIPDGSNTTTGNNVDAGLDVEPPDGIDPNGRPIGNPFRVFSYSYNPFPLGNDPTNGTNFRFGSVTNVFFWANRFHDKLYDVGFTEPARNLQENNFGRGGLEHDPLIIKVHKTGSFLNASAGPDGTSGILVTSEDPIGDTGLDQEATIHEMTHMVSSRLHGNGSGLGSAQAGAMGEGWSDFYPRALLSTSDEALDGNFAFGAYTARLFVTIATDPYNYGLRRFPYALKSSVGPNGLPHNPITFADMDPAQLSTGNGAYPQSPWISNGATEVHNAGEIWCLALLEVRARLIRRLGFVEGNRRALQLVTDGMKLDPLNPRFLQSRDAILAADQIGFSGADLADIWRGFAARGMGVGATSVGLIINESFKAPTRHRFDFDGDSKTDFAVFRPAGGQWFVLNSSDNSMRAQGWGIASDVIVPGDYDGDDKADFAVFRPNDGNWYVFQSFTNTVRTQAWGTNGDVPVPANYDGDNRDDFAVFRGGTWLILQSTNNGMRTESWGTATDRPLTGDYDGDLRADLAVFRPGDGTWYILHSSSNSIVARQFGISTDLPVVGDYDGDGRDDLAVFRSGTWYITQSSDNQFRAQPWGVASDRPVAGDYDGDGSTDLAVFRPSIGTWFILQSSNATVLSRQWGQSGDIAVPSAFVP